MCTGLCRDTGTAISLSAVTTQVGFGTLALSTTQGLAFVGVVALVGITACLVASLCTLPAALQSGLTLHARRTPRRGARVCPSHCGMDSRRPGGRVRRPRLSALLLTCVPIA